MRNLWLLAICFIAQVSIAAPLITNVTIIDAVGGERTGQHVLVEGNRIAAVSGTALEAESTIDGTGKFLIPGLWDMHVHIVYERELTQSMPSLFLDYGITSVRDTGALLHEITPEIERWQELGNQAPDIFFSGPLLDGRLVVYDGDGRTEIGVSTPSAAKAKDHVSALVKAGAGFIKIYELVSPDVFAAYVSAANEAGLPIASHVPLSMIADAAGPRVNSMEHLRNIELACATNWKKLQEKRLATLESPGDRSGYELRRYLHSSQRPQAMQTADVTSKRCLDVIRSLRNTIQVPTLRLNTIVRYSPLNRDDWTDHLGRLPASVTKNWEDTARRFAVAPSEQDLQLSDWSLALIAQMQKEGVPIGAGTDTPIGQAIPGYSLHTELERLVDAGLTPMQALAAATIRPAEFLGLRETRGEIRKGMEADLVLLSANPLDDIRNTRKIEAVISNGTRVR